MLGHTSEIECGIPSHLPKFGDCIKLELFIDLLAQVFGHICAGQISRVIVYMLELNVHVIVIL